MGSGRWDASDWGTYATAHVLSAKSVDDIYTARKIDDSLNPLGVDIRESRDSADNPNSTPVIVALDVTGSMGKVLDAMARTGLATLATEVYDRKPISDPHIMFMGIGDVSAGDRSPLQITQFEADIRIAEQLNKLHLERGGGGNDSESYTLAWLFAGLHTSTDNFEKRGKKGYLFTLGDEEPNMVLTKKEIERVLGYAPENDYTAEQLLAIVSRQYEVFHLIVADTGHYRNNERKILSAWQNLLGERAIILDDHTKMAEVITSTLEVMNGKLAKDVVASWDGSTGLTVAKAINGLVANAKDNGGLVTF